jgi:hypothetical protein
MTTRRAGADARAYRRLEVLLFALFAGYTAIAAVSFVVFRRVETFPLFAYNLFDVVPNVRDLCVILIHEVDGRVIVPARPYAQVRERFAAPAISTSLDIVADRLAHAVASGSPNAVDLRRIVEDNWLRAPGRVRYELVLERMDPLEFRRTGRIREIRSLGMFERSAEP